MVSDLKRAAVALMVPPSEKQSFTDNYELSINSSANKTHMAHLREKKEERNQH